jgi:hypothetical protein
MVLTKIEGAASGEMASGEMADPEVKSLAAPVSTPLGRLRIV